MNCGVIFFPVGDRSVLCAVRAPFAVQYIETERVHRGTESDAERGHRPRMKSHRSRSATSCVVSASSLREHSKDLSEKPSDVSGERTKPPRPQTAALTFVDTFFVRVHAVGEPALSLRIVHQVQQDKSR